MEEGEGIMKKRIHVWGIITLLLVMMTANVKAEEDYGYREVEDAIQAEVVTPVQVNKRSRSLLSSQMPEKYNPLEHDNIKTPAIRNQGNANTCWAFASVALAETSMLKKNIDIDTSEKHLAYFTYNHGVDPLGNTQGDSLELTNGLNYLTGGGNVTFSRYVLANWSGAASETEVPYNTNAVALEEELEYQDIAHLQQARLIQIGENPEIVKSYIMQWGGVAVSYYHAEAYMNNASGGYYYSPTAMGTNHAVALVGWDDTYSRLNFNEDPGADGAWLVKGSYGTSMGLNGYYWISYKDKGLLRGSTAYAFDFESADNYQNNYQYDGAPYSTTLSYNTSSCWEANVFEASASEKEHIQAVGFWTSNESLNYTAYIYTGIEDGKPESGTLADTITGETDCVGYYTVDLNQKVTVKKGDKFSVVINFSSKDESIVSFPAEVAMTGTWYAIKFTRDKGQSFFKAEESSTWTDATENSYGNVRIKAYTDNVENSGYNITYHLNGGINAEENPTTQLKADTLTLKNPTREGYEFAGWYTDEDYKHAVTSLSGITENEIELYAKWNAEEYTITYMDGTTVVNTIAVTYGSKYKMPAQPTKEGYKFLGWYTEEVAGEEITEAVEVELKAAKILYAHWNQNFYEITYHLDGGKNAEENPKKHSKDEVLNLYAPSREGYQFAGWYTDTEYKNSAAGLNGITENQIELYAKWQQIVPVPENPDIKNPATSDTNIPETSDITVPETEESKLSETAATCKITYKLNKGTNNKKNPTKISSNESVTLKAPTRKKYTFAGWYVNNKKVTRLSKVRNAVTVTAKWTKVSVKKANLAKVKKSGKKLKITTKKVSGANGYYIQYATNKKFQSAKKVTTSKLNYTTPNLKKGKTYYIRVRAYKKDSTGAKIYGSYSSIKKIKV